MKLQPNDIVIVTLGKDSGKQGKILKVFPKENKVLVEGVNMYTRHRKPAQGQTKGTTVRTERAMHVSKVAIYNPETKQVDRIGYKTDKDGTKVRIFQKTGKVVGK